MKRGNYLQAKEETKKTANQGVVVLIIFVIIFVVTIVRIAEHAGNNGGFFSLSPKDGDAFKIAQNIIRPASVAAGDASFPSSDFKCTKKTDSIFVVSSYFTTRDMDGEDVKTNFVATLKYNGGDKNQAHNWTLVKLVER